jgi:capsular polysaccharide transport system ATP-binding protein
MIEVSDVNKIYQTRNGPREVLKNITFSLNKGERLGILGRNGAGKSTLIRIISGAEHATTGEIRKTLSISWPLAFTGAFQGSLTGLDNVKFVCRVYGKRLDQALPFVEEFSELGEYLREPVKKYSAGMRARLAFGLSMAIEFDCFLIDEIVAVGDARFQEKCRYQLFEARKDRAMILVSHEPSFIRQYCHRIAVLENGVLKEYPSVDEAYSAYQLALKS